MNANSKEDNDRAGRIWEEGLAKYPNSNLLKVKLGWYHFNAGWNFWSDDIPADFRKAGELVRTVLAKENLTPQVKRLAHWLFAFVLASEGDFNRALNGGRHGDCLGPVRRLPHRQPGTACRSCLASRTRHWNGSISRATRDPNGRKHMNYNKGLGAPHTWEI